VLLRFLAILSVVPLWAASPNLWIPAQQSSWQWQLSGTIDLSVDAEIFDLDLFTTDKAMIDALRARGRRAICYFSAGSYEPYRPDSDRFPAAVKGRAMDGWPDERWLDIRQLDVLGPIMEARLDLCKTKGFGAAEPDNVDGYQNRTGFTLTAADQLRYNRFLANAAHARGLSIGLKNDIDQIGDLVNDFDWALNEECFKYKECGAYQPFTAAGKAVFHVEYGLSPAQFCAQANALNFNSLHKKFDLDAYRVACRTSTAAPVIMAVANAASYSTAGVSPNQILVIFGSSMGPTLSQASSIELPTELSGTRVLFDDTAAGLIYVSEGQVSAVVPASIRGKEATRVRVQRNGTESEARQVPVRSAAPGLFTLDASGQGQAAAVNEIGTVNGPSAPARRGTIVLLYGTGFESGATVRIRIGGADADVLYAGGVSWGVPGLIQINMRIPAAAAVGAAIPLTVEVAGVPAQNGVTLAIAQ
jgi:uncharacterized protein (TIGR03437 family)